MDSVQDGGPAFPQLRPGGGEVLAGYGMTLRDYFAAAALTGLMASATEDWNYEYASGRDLAAEHAYDFADALLARRSQKTTKE